MFNAASPAQLAEALKRHGVTLKKSLGQNFLIDENILKKIASISGAGAGAACLEVGPGAGALTQKLLDAGAHVAAVEIDSKLIPMLQEALEGRNAEIIHQDILKADLRKIYDAHIREPFMVAANLPYYITSPVIMRLLESGLPITKMTLMVQSEVADRMAAQRGKQYSPFSIAVQYHAQVHVALRVSPGCFMPRPEVGSSVVVMEMRAEKAVLVEDEKAFFRLVHSCFAMRRKTAVNNIVAAGLAQGKDEAENVLKSCGIGEKARAEDIPMQGYADILRALPHQLVSKQL
jgi:16S rRNA (adenine1518-N6/adenine1519-N6)-dimethyltransferase